MESVRVVRTEIRELVVVPEKTIKESAAIWFVMGRATVLQRKDLAVLMPEIGFLDFTESRLAYRDVLEGD